MVINDSIISGTTTSKFVRLLKAVGMTKVLMRIVCPPTVKSYYYGIKMSSSVELILNKMRWRK